MKKTLVISTATLMSFFVNAGPVQWGVETGVASIGYWDDDYYETYFLGVGGPGVLGFMISLDFYYPPAQAVVTSPEIMTLGASATLVTTDYGSIIDHDLVFKATDNIFFSFSTWWEYNELTIGMGESVLLAFAAYDFDVDKDEYVYGYGWIELAYGLNEKTGLEEVYVSDSAFDTLGRGMIAGTYNVVPEPATALLALSGLALLFRQRRRKS